MPIQPKGNKIPFFCVHGGFGNVLNFYDLTRYLGKEQPFYGLQARGVDGKQPPFATLPEMAAEYVKQMRVVQPEGPYMVGGFSMGGEVAFEIAQQLHVQGQKVALVALLDTHNPEFARRRKNVLRMAEGPEVETTDSDEDEPEFGGGIVSKLRLLKRWAALRLLLARMDLQKYRIYWRARRLLRAGETLPQSLISPFLWRSHIDLVNSYEIKPYPGRVTLFRASETEIGNPNGEGIGWTPLAQGGLDVHILHGTHNIVKEPYVAELARMLKVSIDKAIQSS